MLKMTINGKPIAVMLVTSEESEYDLTWDKDRHVFLATEREFSTLEWMSKNCGTDDDGMVFPPRPSRVSRVRRTVRWYRQARGR